MAQNEMRALRGMPLRVRSMEGLGPCGSMLRARSSARNGPGECDERTSDYGYGEKDE